MTTATVYAFPTNANRHRSVRLPDASVDDALPCDYTAAMNTASWGLNDRRNGLLIVAAIIVRVMREERARNAARIAREMGMDQLRLAI